MGLSVPVSPSVAFDGAYPVDRASAESFGRSLPLRDPIEAQTLVCTAIARLVPPGPPDGGFLAALLVLDRYAQPIRDLQLVRYVEGDAQLRSLDRKYWQSAMRLSQTFFKAYEHFYAGFRRPGDASVSATTSCLLVHLALHRKFEFLLRLLRYKKPNPEHWLELHQTYALARTQELTADPVAIGQADGKPGATTTLEQQYLQILLLEMMNGGQYSPREMLWASGWFMDWSSALSLQTPNLDGGGPPPDQGFVVAPGSSTGLTRGSVDAAAGTLVLDPSLLMLLIDEEVAALRDANALPLWPAPIARDAQIALLARLRILLAPRPVLIDRRGEREPVSQTVQVLVGLPSIARVLREGALAEAQAIASSSTPVEGDTIMPFHGNTRMPLNTPTGTPLSSSFSTADDLSLLQQAWQLKDRSDSGCRMRGQIRDLNLWIPGSLVALREHEQAPWTLSVVRRFKRLMVDRVEIDVEHIGRRPRFVKIVPDARIDPTGADLPESSRRSFAAIYLPASERSPAMPIKSLLLPAREFRAGSTVKLLSSRATYVLRLNAPIQQHLGFVWTSFAIIDKHAAAAAADASGQVEPPAMVGAAPRLRLAEARP